MTKTMSIRFDDDVAALLAERSERHGVSMNRAVNDAVRRSAEAEMDEVRDWTRQQIDRYRTVMDRLG